MRTGLLSDGVCSFAFDSIVIDEPFRGWDTYSVLHDRISAVLRHSVGRVVRGGRARSHVLDQSGISSAKRPGSSHGKTPGKASTVGVVTRERSLTTDRRES